MKLVWVSEITWRITGLSLFVMTLEMILYRHPTILIGLNSSIFVRLSTFGTKLTQVVLMKGEIH